MKKDIEYFIFKKRPTFGTSNLKASSPQHPSEHASRVALAAGETLISNAQSADQMETEMTRFSTVC